MFNKKPPSINNQQIIRASKSDYNQLANFFNQNPCIHRHLDWFGPLDWLGQQPYFIKKTNDQVQAALCAAPENKETAWIRVFGIRKNQKIHPIWDKMLDETVQELRIKDINLLASLSLHTWFQTLLEESGFVHKQNIVVLEWQGELPNGERINQGIEIRKMEFTDLPVVEEIDQLAFPPLWQNSTAGLTKAFNQTGISTVAIKGGEIIGYQISTAMTIYSHLARLAVHPDHQRQGIAYTLVYDLLKRFKQQGFWRVTVNTQSDNRSSLKLYEKFDFKPTGEEIPVYKRFL